MAPAINKCGIFVKSIVMLSPPDPLPKAIGKESFPFPGKDPGTQNSGVLYYLGDGKEIRKGRHSGALFQRD